jgi:hypothetical protein
MVSFEALKSGMERNGEVMIRLKMVEEIELHKQNVRFENATREIVVGSGTNEIYVYRTDLT